MNKLNLSTSSNFNSMENNEERRRSSSPFPCSIGIHAFQSCNSELFPKDSSGFGTIVHSYVSTAQGHQVSSPYELAQYPIEMEQNRKELQEHLSEIVRKETQQNILSEQEMRSLIDRMNETGETQKDEQGFQDADSPNLSKAASFPQLLELHTFRDSLDVNYQRMAFTGEELSGVPLEDLRTAAKELIEALQIRFKYMRRIGHQFPVTTERFVSGFYPQNLPKGRRKATIERCQKLSSSWRKISAISSASTHLTSYHPPNAPEDHWRLYSDLPQCNFPYSLKMKAGIVHVFDENGEIAKEVHDFYTNRDEFLDDTHKLTVMLSDGALCVTMTEGGARALDSSHLLFRLSFRKTFCFRRLSYLQNKFQLHVLLNEVREMVEQKCVPHRDFYNIRKVDTHVHASSAMNQKHLLRFIKKKMRDDADRPIMLNKDGKEKTMSQVFEALGIDAYDISVDKLDVHADRDTFHRFDKFNSKYNPVGESQLREIFIKTDNHIGGRYFAEVLKEVMSDLEDSKYQQSELRLSIYGHSRDEWDKLAIWAIDNDVWSPNVRWMVQIPRLYDVYRAKGMVSSFSELLENVFLPLFEVTVYPEQHPELARFLPHVSGLDSVDDESKMELFIFDKTSPSPECYSGSENPSYSYYIFYLYSNITVLNALRRCRNLNTLTLRPHCGEAGHVNHLITGFLTAESIAHGLMLRKVPVLQYLFYLSQLGIAMSPLSNNSLFLNYHRNPLPEYHMKGLNVSLSTDDPLQFHYTKEPLMEEYSIAAQVWKLSTSDMCELARNSVLQSGFEDQVKVHWLGPHYREGGVLGNDVSRTNVPNIRVSFRHETLVDELCNIFRAHPNTWCISE